MIYALAATGIATSLTGFGIVLAAWDAATIGVVVAAVASLVTAIVSGCIAVMNARTKNHIDEMKAQMEAQKELSALNRQSLTTLHTALAQNTLETVKGVNATDQMKQRVEQLEQKLPAPDTKEIK